MSARLQQLRPPLIPIQDCSFLPKIKREKRRKLLSGQLLQTQGQKTLQNMFFNKPDIYVWLSRHPQIGTSV